MGGWAIWLSSRVPGVLAAAALLAAALFALPAQALDRERALSQMHHSGWPTSEGPPGTVNAIAQTRDGYLWLGGPSGLFRFDGVRFERFEAATGLRLPSTNIATLKAAADGGLWIGYRFGGASRFVDGGVTDYRVNDGFPRGSVTGFAIAADGDSWVAASGGLAHLVDGAWRIAGEADSGYDGGTPNTPLFDRQGGLWVPSEQGVYRLPRGAAAFQKVGASIHNADLAMAPDGSVWVSDGEEPRFARLPPAGAVVDAALQWHRFPLSADRFLFDRDGAMWVGTVDGVVRIRDPEQAPPASGRPAADGSEDAAGGERFGRRLGLTGDFAFCLFEDREGNIWVGTGGGLDRLRGNKLEPIEISGGKVGNIALAADDGSGIWAINNFRSLHRIGIGRDQSLPKMPGDVTAMHRDFDGRIWLGGVRLWTVDQGRAVDAMPMPDGIGSINQQVQAITRDRSGALWISIIRLGVFKWGGGAWQAVSAIPDAPGATAICLLADTQSRVWIGYPEGRVGRVDGDRSQLFGGDRGPAIGNVLSLYQRGERIWAGGESGLAVFDGQGFRKLQTVDPESLAGISGMAASADGDLWLNGSAGITRIPAAEIDQALRTAGYAMHGRRFDFRDGLVGQPRQIRPLATAVAAADGRLWFALENGLVTVDPQHIAANPMPPPVLIQAVQADGRRYPPRDALELPMRTANLKIEYTATSLAIPERMRFRYRLEGVDPGWQEAGTRREAFYTNLQPGRYRFRVIASNDDGVWNEQGAALSFVVPPAFTQTLLFRLLCAALALALIAALYLLRLRQISTRLRLRLEARHQERERIARELHDTLLQGIQGLTLRFQAAMMQIPEQEPARQMMEKALDRADDVLVEGRDRVRELRTASETIRDLPEALARIGDELSRDHGGADAARRTAFRMVVQGAPRPLHPLVHDEVYRIAREALANAFQHARADRIEAELRFDRDELRLQIRDDGCGIDPSLLAAGGKPGHWGLAGMRERAAQIGAQLRLGARLGSGTELELRVPAAGAYRDQSGSARWSWLRRIVGAGR